MNERQNEVLFDLLTKKAVYGLDEAEEKELESFDSHNAAAEFLTLEMTAAAISMIDFTIDESMPAHVAAKISESAQKWVGGDVWPPVYKDTGEKNSPRAWFAWLGWGAALAAGVALAANIYLTRIPPQELAQLPPAIEKPKVLTVAEKREELLRSTAGLVKANWAPGNVKDLKNISGDVIWSDEKQTGYVRLSGLPANDKAKETYQLWIFDKGQDKATPIDGGTFDVASNGETVLAINAAIKALEPGMFAVTVEKPGGVVVSKREKIAALATVETKTS